MFVELTSDELLREWLPKLVGIERSPLLRLADHREAHCVVEEQHERRLTRDDITSTIHYVRFELTDAEVKGFMAGPVTLAVDHDAYRESVVLSAETVAELAADLQA